MRILGRWRSISGLLLLLAVAGCHSDYERPAPPRSETAPSYPVEQSTLSVPIAVSVDGLQARLEQAIPRKLWSIDQQQTCLKKKHAHVFGKSIAVLPKIGCRIVGDVNRGPIRLTGSGRELGVSFPVSATIAARDVGGILKGETATGSADVRAIVGITVDKQWKPHARVHIAYDWKDPPGIDFAGKRIQFTSRADEKLAGVIKDVEAEVQKEIEKVKIVPVLEGVWKDAFATFIVNRENPTVWMRTTPLAVGFAGYRVEGRTLKLLVKGRGNVETFVQKDAPETPKPTPFPPQTADVKGDTLQVNIPVVAEYAQLEPVILKALRKLAAKGIGIEDVGSVNADFQKVTLYATEGDKIAVGVEARVEPVDRKFGTRWKKAQGRVWLTGTLVQEGTTELFHISDLDIYGGADSAGADLLIKLLSSPMLRDEIQNALTQNFDKYYQKLIVKIRNATAERQLGDFLIRSHIDSIRHGKVQVTGSGLYMPAVAVGKAALVYQPRKAQTQTRAKTGAKAKHR